MHIKENKKNSNVNFIKLLAAVMVILCHAYPLTGNGVDIVQRVTNGKLGLGMLGVSIFFIYSGFFLTASLERDDRITNYIKKRVLRIFPELIIVVLLSVFLLGPIFTKWDLRDYFLSAQTYKYMLNALLIPVQNLPGVFENSPYLPTVNGSLWTLPVEFMCYILLILIKKIKQRVKERYINILLICALFIVGSIMQEYLANSSYPILASVILPVQLFVMGHIWWENRERVIFDIRYWVIAVFALVINTIIDFGVNNILYIILFSYSILSLSNVEKQWVKSGVWEKLSYGIYLCGFPVGQIVVESIPGIRPIPQFMITILFSVVLAFVLYKIKEKWWN